MGQKVAQPAGKETANVQSQQTTVAEGQKPKPQGREAALLNLQRTHGNRHVKQMLKGGMGVLQRKWSDAPFGPLGGARSPVTATPSFGWNRGEVSIDKIRRIPIEALTQGNQDSNKHPAAEEDADKRAIVLIPSALNLTQPVEVLLHLHGHNVGYRQRKTQGRHPTLQPGTVRDIDTDRIEQQLQISNRPMIGVLAQGTTSSGFGIFNSDAYLRDAFSVLGSMGVWGQNPVPQIQRVILTGHSGAGDPISKMMSEPSQHRLPSSLGEVALFDAINSSNELDSIRKWVTDRLNQDLSALTASGMIAGQQLSYLATSLRFRAYYTNSSYTSAHQMLQQAIDRWFSQHASALGGNTSNLYQRLYNNYQTKAVGHGDHEVIMSRGDRLVDALSALPPASMGNTGMNAPTSAPTGSSQQGGSLTPPATAPNAVGPATIQRRTINAGQMENEVPPVVYDVLDSNGLPLDSSARSFFEPRFEYDFSDVRVHTDSKASQSAQEVNALAYTIGRDVVFNTGQYAPDSVSGKELLAHELTHVVQQGGSVPTGRINIGEPGDHDEQTADSIAKQLIHEPEANISRLAVRSTLDAETVQCQTTSSSLAPIRANEKGETLVSFDHGKFSIFIPEKVILGSRKDITNLKVHVFFSAAGAMGNMSNDILTHGLRGSSNQSEWVTIGVPLRTTISDQEIQDCLNSIGITSNIVALRLSGHSRGAFSLLKSIVQKKITTLSKIEHVIILDADENPIDPQNQNSETKIPKSQILISQGIDPSKITVYEVNVIKKHPLGVNYIKDRLNSDCMASIGYVRLIEDAKLTKPNIANLVANNPAISTQLNSLPLPARGLFTTSPVMSGKRNIQEFCKTYLTTIQAILANESHPTNGLLTFINTNDLARFETNIRHRDPKDDFRWNRGIAAHHFFVAEIAHELTE